MVGFDRQRQAALCVARQGQRTVAGRRQRGTDEISGDRQFAPPPVDQRGEHDALRTTKIEQHVHRRARGTARVEHVINEQNDRAVDVKAVVEAVLALFRGGQLRMTVDRSGRVVPA